MKLKPTVSVEPDPRPRTGRLLVLAGVLWILAGCGTSQSSAEPPARDEVFVTQQAEFRVETVASGLEHPWGLTFLPDGGMLVTERPGQLRQVDPEGRLLREPIGGLPEITAVNQGGLLDVALHPDFTTNRWVYIAYVASGRGGVGTEVARGRLADGRLDDLETLFVLRPKSRGGRHFGARLVFDRDGYLFITLGDRGDRPRAQRLDDHAGSLIRLHDDGRIPEDNPFVDRADAEPAIYNYGHRNIQGADLHPETGTLWTHEHGPQGGDELNREQPGANYGWPVITYGVNYGTGTPIGEGTRKPGMEQPLYYWDPSIAPSGMAFYTGDRFPEWQGDLFVGALKYQLLVRLELDGTEVVAEERMLQYELGRIRDVRQGPDGLLYVLTDSPDGRVARLVPAD